MSEKQNLLEVIRSQKPVLSTIEQTRYTQAIINMLIYSGKLAQSAGLGNPTNSPLNRSSPDSMVKDLQLLLEEIAYLVACIDILNEE